MTSSALGKLKLKTQDENRYGKIIHSGFLNKRSKGKSWTKRFAVLWEDMGLRFYETESRGNVVGKIKMKYINEIKKLSIEQSSALDGNHPYFFSIVSASLKKTWQFGCNDTEELSEWVHILQSALTVNKRENDTENRNEAENRENIAARNSNMYIGHHGHNLSNMEDFSIAHSISSRVSSIQSLSALAINNINNMDTIDGIEEEEDVGADADADTNADILEIEVQQIGSNLLKQIEERLTAENTNIVFEGHLDRKTNQRVLGKHLWETRYFKLSTHSLSIYTHDKTNIAESVIKLSSFISVNRNTKNDGNDLNTNRFDINTKNKTLNLRTENEAMCQQWIHFLSSERRKHRKSIRSNLKSLVTLKKRTPAAAPIRRFKRQKTSRDTDIIEDIDENGENADKADTIIHDIEDEFDEDYVAPIAPIDQSPDDNNHNKTRKNRVHSRNLSMKSWASDIEKRHNDSISFQNKLFESRVRVSITKPESFEGFLIRKIAHNTDKIGEKIYFRLSDDTLEFSKIDEMITNTNNDINKLHSSNIMGTISVEHIKSVEMISDEKHDEFIITFNENNSSTDWILKTEKNDQGNAIKWVTILQRAQKEAKDITKTINNEKKKQICGSIKTLQKMINDETIEELEMARNHELNHTKINNLDKGFEINSLENKESSKNNNHATNAYACSCFCFH